MSRSGGWVRSLQCKSGALEDVLNPYPKHLLSSSSCRKSAQTLKDVVLDHHHHHHRRRHHSKRSPASAKPKPNASTRAATPTTPAPSPSPSPPDPFHRRGHSADAHHRSLTELPDGHPSRNVVEIIFHTSWASSKPFSGRVELVFKVHNASRTVVRFEDYRRSVRDRACSLSSAPGATAEEDARCAADGNEMMRFHCLGPTGDGGGSAWVFPWGKAGGAAICTFSGSGRAHESAGGGSGRRAMLVCRVIAGRVSKRGGLDSVMLEGRVDFDSVSGDGGELVVFDPRAVLPCFLVVYKL